MTNNTNAHHEHLDSLQGGRAIAALLVIFYHNGLIFSLNKYWGYDPTHSLFNFAHAGVEFFFVLSGFIIFYIHGKDLGQPSKFSSYAIKRFLRIYPVYWIILAVVIFIYLLVPSFGLPYQREASTILSSVLLVHVNGNSNMELASAWTLYHEMLFYSVFALGIINKRFGITVIAVWLLASAATLGAKPSSYTIEFLISPLHLLFGMGMASCWIVTNTRIVSPGMIALAGMAVFIAAGMDEDYILWLNEMPRNLIYGFGSALILIGIVELERQSRLKVPARLLLIGNASYVIYLINFTVLSFLAKIFMYMGAREGLPVLISYILLALLSVFFGVLVYLWIERPVLQFLRLRLRNYTDRKIHNKTVFHMPFKKALEHR